jgi:hypothetical protein
MNHHYLSTALCAVGILGALTACSGNKSYTIEGTLPDVAILKDLPDEYRNVYIISCEEDTLCRATLDDAGKFTVTGAIDHPQFALLHLGDEQILPLVVEPGHIRVTIEEWNAPSGTEQNDAITAYLRRASDIESYYMEQLASQQQATATYDSLSIFNVSKENFLQIAEELQAATAAMTDSVYRANSDNEVGLFIAICQAYSMPAEDFKAQFGDNKHVMSCKMIQAALEAAETPSNQ